MCELFIKKDDNSRRLCSYAAAAMAWRRMWLSLRTIVVPCDPVSHATSVDLPPCRHAALLSTGEVKFCMQSREPFRVRRSGEGEKEDSVRFPPLEVRGNPKISIFRNPPMAKLL